MKLYKNCHKPDIQRISRKEAEEWLGKEKLESRIAEGKAAYAEDPYQEISWADGFMIEFEID